MRNFKKTLITTAFMSSMMFGGIANAEENLWVYTKGTDTRPQGSYEAKLSDVIRSDKGSGQYAFHDIRAALEYGVTNNFTVGVNALFMHHDYSVNADNGPGPMNETQDEGKNGRLERTRYGGYRLSTKYNILSPYKDVIGLSLGFSFEDRQRYRLDGAQIHQKSYIPTVFLQKNWLDDTLVFAFNWTTEFERRKSPDYEVLEEEIAFDVSAGISYRFMPKHFVGLEIRSQSDYLSPSEGGEKSDKHQSSNFDSKNLQLGTRHQIGTYVGPTYHYAEKNWWLTTGILFQVHGDGSADSDTRDGKNYDEHERVHLGFMYGYEF